MTGHDRSLMIKKPAATPTRHNDLTQSGPEPDFSCRWHRSSAC